MFIESYDYLLFFFYGLIFFVLTKKFLQKRATPQEYKWFIISWLLKMGACLAYAWMIVYYYGYGDPLGYYNLGSVLRNAVVSDPSNFSYFFHSGPAFKQVAASFTKDTDLYLAFDYYNDSNFVIHKLSCLISFFTFNRFLLISMVFANMSFWGSVIIYKALKKLFPAFTKQIALAAFFIPSFLFWSSGLAKEPLCVLCEGIIFYYVVEYITGKKPSLMQLLLVVVTSYVLFTVKNYIFICLLAGILLWLFYNSVEKFFKQRPLLKLAFFMLLFSGVALEAFLLWNSLQAIMRDNIGEIIASNSSSYRNIYNYQSGGSLIEVDNFDRSDAGSVLAFLPKGLVNVFFRPWPWEISNPLMVLTVLENLFFLFLFVKLLLHTRFFTRHVAMEKSFQLFALTFSLSLALIIGISTFNFGTLVRYRIPFLPFWVLFLLLKSSKENSMIDLPLPKKQRLRMSRAS